jgi:hypothetical protein
MAKGLEHVEWIHLAQDKDWWQGSGKQSNEPSVSMIGGEFLDYMRIRDLLHRVN